MAREPSDRSLERLALLSGRAGGGPTSWAAHAPSGWVPHPDDPDPTVLPAAGIDDEPPPGARRRWSVPRRAAVAAVVLSAALLLGGAGRLLTGGPEVVEVARTRHPSPSAAEGRPGTGVAAPPDVGRAATRSPQVVVDVVGRVRRPGVLRLPAGSRVVDAIAAAGGVAPGAAVQRVNLARPVVDGEQIVVPGPGGAAAPAAGSPVPGGATGRGGGAGGPLDLNTATEPQLDDLPGVGPVLAGRILEWRTQHGRFSRVEELGEVPGIGPKVLERLRPLVTA